MSENLSHPVIEEIARRKKGESPQLRLALAVEGGGIRSAVTAGMVSSLASSDIDPLLFDGHFGSSGGSYVSGYYLSERTKTGATIFYENNRGGEFIDLKQMWLRRRPVLSLDHVLGTVMEDKKPFDFERVIDSKRLHVLATKLASLTRHIFEPASSVEELKKQLRGGATIPAVVGEPVEIDGDLYLDAGLTEPMPYQAAIDRGYEGVLLLSSRPDNEPEPGKNDALRKIVTFALSRKITIKRREILDLIASRKIADAESLAELKDKTENPQEPPFVFAIHPSVELPVLNQLEKNPKKIINGISSGYLAVKRVLGEPEPKAFKTEQEFLGVY